MQYLTHLIVNLETSKKWVLKAHVHTNHVVDKSVALVSFQRRGDGQPSSCITIQNVDKLLFLHRS